jgi:hypothetical protein
MDPVWFLEGFVLVDEGLEDRRCPVLGGEIAHECGWVEALPSIEDRHAPRSSAGRRHQECRHG